MSKRLNEGRKFMKSWTWNMAHELKTPLAILYRDLEIHFEQSQSKPLDRNTSLGQIKKISETITNFLDWSELNQQQKVGNLFALDVSKAISEVTTNLDRLYPDRIQIELQEDFKVVINPLHLEQLIRNLLENALKYSSSEVHLHLTNKKMLIKDSGSGLPESVLTSLGQPFNKGMSTGPRGLGLGLAWVHTICKVYNLKLSIYNIEGCTVEIDFQTVAADQDLETIEDFRVI